MDLDLDLSVLHTDKLDIFSAIIEGDVAHIYIWIIIPVRSTIYYICLYNLRKHELPRSLWLGFLHASGLEII